MSEDLAEVVIAWRDRAVRLAKMVSDLGLAELIAARRLPPPAECRRIRKRAGVSQAELASHLGVTRQAVAAWEQGLARPQNRRAVLYAAALKLMSDLE